MLSDKEKLILAIFRAKEKKYFCRINPDGKFETLISSKNLILGVFRAKRTKTTFSHQETLSWIGECRLSREYLSVESEVNTYKIFQ